MELENVHDSGIEFEPIHRVVFGVDTHKAIAWLSEKLSEQNGETEMHLYGSKAERTMPWLQTPVLSATCCPL